MQEIKLKLRSQNRGADYIVEQGVPVFPMDVEEVADLRLLDEDSQVIPASIEPDGQNGHGKTVWLRIAASVATKAALTRDLTLTVRPDLPQPGPAITVRSKAGGIKVQTPTYRLKLTDPGGIELITDKGSMLKGDIGFQLWPDARSIVGAGAGTCVLDHFIPNGWTVEEQTPYRCLLLLRGRVPKLAAYTFEAGNYDPTAQFDCELELICYAFSPEIRLRWRCENYTEWQAFLERYALALPLAGTAVVKRGERSEDGKYLRHVTCETQGGEVTLVAGFVDALGAGARINVERRNGAQDLTLEKVAELAGDAAFEPHRHLAAEKDEGGGLDIVVGGINPPFDGCQSVENPQVHRLFYQGMGRTFEASLLADCDESAVEAVLNPVYFEIDPNHYSRTGALPENGDPVVFDEFRKEVDCCAEWMVRNQWRGSLWWGEWWREWDVYRRQGVEGTSSGNSALAPLYHFWRTGDPRLADCAKRSMEFTYDIQLSKRRVGLGTFFQSRRFLMDRIEWVHPRYQRIDGVIKASHFFGDRRVRTKVIEAMRQYAQTFAMANGGPGCGSGGPYGKPALAGIDCVNFMEVLAICWRETGDNTLLEKAGRMARWTVRKAARIAKAGDLGSSNLWRYVLRGALAYIKATGDKRMRKWYLDKARMNMKMDGPEWGFVMNHSWLIVEAEKMSGEQWLLEALTERARRYVADLRPDGGITARYQGPATKWQTTWDRHYDANHIVAYLPVLAARRAALGMKD